jgi:hypothetical protein
MADLESTITALWEARDDLTPGDADALDAVREAIDLLDRGEARVAELAGDSVVVHEWLKYAILLLFRLSEMRTTELGPFEYADKIPLKHGYQDKGVRVVPGASARWGAHLEPGVILMPSYVNIGARVGSGSMVDTWATVGSCAQIGRNVHLSGGVGIGGVLEPPQAAPVIVGDECLVGSRCIGRRRCRARRRDDPHRLDPGDRGVERERGRARRGAAVDRRRRRQPGTGLSRRHVRVAVRPASAPVGAGGAARQVQAERRPARARGDGVISARVCAR